MKKIIISRESAVDVVRQFFRNHSDIISLTEAYEAWGRDVAKDKENRAWIANKLTDLKYYDLVVPIYTTQNNRRVLKSIQLTIEGKRALGRIGDVGPTAEITKTNRSNAEITIDDIMKAIPRLKKENPDFEILFKVTPKEE